MTPIFIKSSFWIKVVEILLTILGIDGCIIRIMCKCTFSCLQYQSDLNFSYINKRIIDENKSSCLSVASGVTSVPTAAVDPSGWGSSPSEEISWDLTFPLPLSSHNIPLLLQLTGIRIKEENKASCCNILWGFWHHLTSVRRVVQTLLLFVSFLASPTEKSSVKIDRGWNTASQQLERARQEAIRRTRRCCWPASLYTALSRGSQKHWG